MPAMSTTHPSFQVEVLGASGTPQHFTADAGQTVLQAARQAGVRLPRSCQNGTCRSCICLLVRGEIQYRIEWPGLSREEQQEGWILPCVAEAHSDLLIQLPV